MFKFLTLSLFLISNTLLANPFSVAISGGGDIRVKGPQGSVSFVSFKEVLIQRLVNKYGVDVTSEAGSKNADVQVTYDYKIDRSTFYGISPQGTYTVEMTNIVEGTKTSFSFNCGYSVNDGGNTTMKTSCSNKLAKKIAANL